MAMENAKIKHFLKDGSQVDEISGYKVNPDENPCFYAVLKEIRGEHGTDENIPVPERVA